jgi:tripartite-type tricarboxylate transporter receptor subunit TctC
MQGIRGRSALKKGRANNLVRLLLSTWAAAVGLPAGAADYPERPIRIIAPSAPGGGADLVGRLLAQGFTERLGRQVVVDNRAGASTMMGGEMVAKAAPDGYTLLVGISTLAINPATFKHVPYDALRDFSPITQAVSVPNIMIVNLSLPVKTVKEMIALAKQRPGEVLYASPGQGTSAHLTVELFATMTKVRLVHIPYKSQGPGLIATVSGEVSLMAPSITSALPVLRAGKVRALGMTSTSRASIAPDIPTFAEQGLTGFEAGNWFGLLAPAGTPAEIIAKLNREAVVILQTPGTKQRLAGEGAEVVASQPGQFAAFIRQETEKWAKVAKAAGIQPE